MTREEYKTILLSKGFVFEQSQDAWSQHRGQEDKYTHPDYKNYFYIKRISDEDGSSYGLNAQDSNGKRFDKIFPHNAVDSYRDKGQFMWVDNAFMELMQRLSPVGIWVISSNPDTYNAEGSLAKNGEMDWATKNDFKVGDIVYVYEVAAYRGGIVYKTEVTKTKLSLEEKIDDRQFWPGQSYPDRITSQTRFSRLKLIGKPSGDIIPLESLKQHGFTPPQVAYHVSESLYAYLEPFFEIIDDNKDEAIANEVISNDTVEEVAQALKALANDLPPKRVERVMQKIARDPKIARLFKVSKQHVCEICGREPFIQKNGQPYAEADHIKPLGGAYGGLDTPENMRCLCAQCHAIVTHGSDEVVRELLASTKWKS